MPFDETRPSVQRFEFSTRNEAETAEFIRQMYIGNRSRFGAATENDARFSLARWPRSPLTSVAQVAKWWGWVSPSQFTAACRQRFGVPPSRTLRA